MANPIQTENAQNGTTLWNFSNLSQLGEIGVYCDKTSYNPNDVVTFYVSTKVNATTWTGIIFRLGWYYGAGARQIATIAQQTGVAQGYWDGTTLTNDTNQIFNSTTHNLETGWSSSTTWTIPSNAVTGVYLVQLQDANGKQQYCSFVVKGNATADYVYLRPDLTDTAYNSWGGHSLYTNTTVDVQCSFNKPNFAGGGAGILYQLSFELQGIRWMEREGYNISYLSMVDAHVNAAQLLTYKAILSGGHNEYWTKAIRDGVEAAIAAGVGVAFLGANHSFWQCRLDTDNAGNANRTITCYKVTTVGANLALDPQYGVNNAIVTSQWRDAVLGRKENSMMGIMYSNVILGNTLVHWTVDASADAAYLSGTGLVAGVSYGCDLVGYEYDKIQSGSPAGLKTIATTSVTDTNSQADTHNTTYYIAPSGAFVFASGSISFTWALDSYRWSTVCTNTFIPEMQKFMKQIMNALIANKQAKSWSLLNV